MRRIDHPPLDLEVFCADYAAARERFRSAAATAGAELVAYAHPLQGPAGETLATDAAWLGPKEAGAVLVVISGTHGVEGFAGSACQIDWLAGGAAGRPAELAVLLIHAANPWGFAWLRRVSEAGVDLNRNWIDFDAPRPPSPGYDALAGALLPPDLAPATLAAADASIAAYQAAHGPRGLAQAVAGGQYGHPAGLFYGGSEPSWSRRTEFRIVADFDLGGRDLVALVDLHSGEGRFGYGEAMSAHDPAGAAAARARRWYGEGLTESLAGTSVSIHCHGATDQGWMDLLGDPLSVICLEFGTYPLERVLAALRADHVMHARGEPDWEDPRWLRVKTELVRAFHPGTADWQEMVLLRARQVLRQAIAGLARDVGARA